MLRDKRAVVAINPYAAPTVSNAAFDSAYAGIGVWNDDGLLVIHSDAELPPYCLRSGEPTDERIFIEAGWLYRSFTIRLRAKVLAVPLAKPWRVKWAKWLLALWVLLGGSIIAGMFDILGDRAWSGILVVEAVFVITTITLVWWFRDDIRPLIWVRSEGQYRWLKGAGPEFLKRLPQWPPTD